MSELDVHVKYITKSIETLANANTALDKRLREHMDEEVETTAKLHLRIGGVEGQLLNAKFYFAGVTTVATLVLALLQIYLS